MLFNILDFISIIYKTHNKLILPEHTAFPKKGKRKLVLLENVIFRFRVSPENNFLEDFLFQNKDHIFWEEEVLYLFNIMWLTS